MPVASVREIEIYYGIYGRGARVLLISGTGETVARSRDRYKEPLVEQFEVLMYDQRGLGQTSHPDVEYSMADYADDAAGLLRSVGWSKCHVVGVSFGGMVAQHLAIRHPELVDRLVLACTTSGGQGGSSCHLLQLESMSPTERILKLLPVLESRNDPTAQPPRWAPGLESFFASAGSPLPDDPGPTRGISPTARGAGPPRRLGPTGGNQGAHARHRRDIRPTSSPRKSRASRRAGSWRTADLLRRRSPVSLAGSRRLARGDQLLVGLARCVFLSG
jgi:pimeloyl-ACP methyl ester carboxylesterase